MTWIRFYLLEKVFSYRNQAISEQCYLWGWKTWVSALRQETCSFYPTKFVSDFISVSSKFCLFIVNFRIIVSHPNQSSRQLESMYTQFIWNFFISTSFDINFVLWGTWDKTRFQKGNGSPRLRLRWQTSSCVTRHIRLIQYIYYVYMLQAFIIELIFLFKKILYFKPSPIVYTEKFTKIISGNFYQ